ncbi:MAG TPA: zf-HC2 domain-containing protein, partial [Thermomicrobiaceae bacterium]|nr:zf-HC2 domain-containing protein [Thermomicrobiaceae bacterium]
MQRLISASLDGELSPEDEQRLQVHLDNCHECRQTRDVYRANRDLIQRNLPGNAEPPQFVTDEILRKTREISNSTGLRRLILGSRLRLTMSVVATIAVAIIASSFFLVQNYRNGISPTIAGSSPQGYSAQCKTDQVARNWPINSPVKITFDRPMNHTSVLKNLSVYNQNLPPGGLSTLPPTSWDGNTLIIGQNPTKTAAWAAGTYYAITVMPQAKGTNGKALGTTRFLCFLTASSISANNLSVTPT